MPRANLNRRRLQLRAVPGSEKLPLPRASVLGPPDPHRYIEVTVLIRPAARTAARPALSIEDLGSRLPHQRQHLSREVFAAEYAADPADLRDVAAFARHNGLQVIGQNAGARTLHLGGTIANFSWAFGVDLMMFRYPNGVYRGRTGPIHVPAALDGVVRGVFGLDNRRVARTHFRSRPDLGGAWQQHAAGVAYTPDEVGRVYDFPTGVTGAGQCVGIIELGGGFSRADLTSYFRKLEIDCPEVVAVPMQGRHNRPTLNPDGPDGQVMLDIEVVGAVAPGARIAVYFAPDTDQGFLRAVNRAVHDKVNKPTVISISWGGPESSWTHQSLQAFDEAFSAAARLGVSVCVATGDGGASDGVAGSLANVDFPASSPHVLACGGTRLVAADGEISSETVWNGGVRGGATGGGVSDFFARPPWQKGAEVPASINPAAHQGRGVPDVAANADIATGFRVRVDGTDTVFGGTGAVAPLWAGLTALVNEEIGTPIGFWNPLLYTSIGAGDALRDITDGNNELGGAAGYAAGKGWDACTGFGSPNGEALIRALRGSAGAARSAGSSRGGRRSGAARRRARPR